MTGWYPTENNDPTVAHLERDPLVEALVSRVAPRALQRTASWLDTLDRRPGGRGLQQACEELVARCDRAGATQVQLRSYGQGPGQRYFGWTGERQPFVEEAELWLVEADGRESLLQRATDDPGCLVGALRSTAPEGEVFEVIEVGPGTRASDYRGRRIAGRVALSWGRLEEAVLFEALCARQAAGLLLANDECPAAIGAGDGSRLGGPALYAGNRPFVFRLGREQRARVLARLARNESVRVRVRLQTTLDAGELPVVSAAITGSAPADGEVVVVGVVAEPEPVGTVACVLEALRVASSAVVDAVVSPPLRSLRFVFVPGVHGMVAWLADRQSRAEPRLRAALQLTLRDEIQESAVRLYRPPTGRASFVADAVVSRLRSALRRAVDEGPYRPGAAIAPLVDRDLAVPAAWLLCPRAFVDAPGGCTPRLVAGLAAAALELACIDRRDLPRLISTCQVEGTRRLVDRAVRLRREVHAELRAAGDGRQLRHLLWLTGESLHLAVATEVAAVRGAADYLDGAGSEAVRIATVVGDLEQTGRALQRSIDAEIAAAARPRARLEAQRRPLAPRERRADAVVVERIFEGPPPLPALRTEVGEKDRRWLAGQQEALAGQPAPEQLLALIDGQRSLRAICDRLSFDHGVVDLQLLWRYLQVLQSAGLVRLTTTDDP